MDRDPNQLYVPVPYPRMLYSTPTAYLIVQDEAEEARARATGYTDFADVDPAKDGLEHLSHEHLIDRALHFIRQRLWSTPREGLIAQVRDMQAEADRAAVKALEPNESTADVDAMSDDALRAIITERDGKPPHHRAGRDRLLALARGVQAPDDAE